MTFNLIREIIDKNGFDFVVIQFIDFSGQLREFDIHKKYLEETVLLEDFKIKLIPEVYFVDPFRSISTFVIWGQIEGEFSSRSVMMESYDLIKKYCKNICISFKLNFFIIDNLSNDKYLNYKELYDYKYDTSPFDILTNIRAEIAKILVSFGINVLIHYQAKYKNQSTLILEFNSFSNFIDYIYIAKYVISNVTVSYNKKALFSIDNDYKIMELSFFLQDIADAKFFIGGIKQHNLILGSFFGVSTSNFIIDCAYNLQILKLNFNFFNLNKNLYLIFAVFLLAGKYGIDNSLICDDLSINLKNTEKTNIDFSFEIFNKELLVLYYQKYC